MSGSICFKAQNRANRLQFFSDNSRFLLTLNPFRNSITFAIVRFSLCMSTISKRSICRPPRRTSYPSLSTSGFILVNSMYLWSVPRVFPGIDYCLALLEIQYLLHLWYIVCACQRDIISNLVHHHGELLVQNGTLVDLQWGLQLG